MMKNPRRHIYDQDEQIYDEVMCRQTDEGRE